MEKKILNIIIAGTGGQGVITLSDMIRSLATENGFHCEGATFKGGAQRMGTVYTELRIQSANTEDGLISSQIPQGEVDVLIGLEPWETLRFAKWCHSATKVITNTRIEKLYVERMSGVNNGNPIEILQGLFESFISDDYSAIASSEMGNRKAANAYLLMAAIENNYLPFKMEQLEKIKTTKK